MRAPWSQDVFVEACVSYFSHCCDKVPDEGDFRKEEFVQGYSSELEAAGHMTLLSGSRERNTGAEKKGFLLFIRGWWAGDEVEDPAHGWCCP